jgi:hypothetical protein
MFRVGERLDNFGQVWTVVCVRPAEITVCRRVTDLFGKSVDIDHRGWHPRQLETHMVRLDKEKTS